MSKHTDLINLDWCKNDIDDFHTPDDVVHTVDLLIRGNVCLLSAFLTVSYLSSWGWGGKRRWRKKGERLANIKMRYSEKLQFTDSCKQDPDDKEKKCNFSSINRVGSVICSKVWMPSLLKFVRMWWMIHVWVIIQSVWCCITCGRFAQKSHFVSGI